MLVPAAHVRRGQGAKTAARLCLALAGGLLLCPSGEASAHRLHPLSPAELVAGAELVVVAAVTAVSPFPPGRATGCDPGGPRWLAVVERTVAGEAGSAGRAPVEELALHPPCDLFPARADPLQAGARYLLFLHRADEGAWTPVGGGQGLLRLVEHPGLGRTVAVNRQGYPVAVFTAERLRFSGQMPRVGPHPWQRGSPGQASYRPRRAPAEPLVVRPPLDLAALAAAIQDLARRGQAGGPEAPCDRAAGAGCGEEPLAPAGSSDGATGRRQR